MSGAARAVALVCTGDDPDLSQRLRAAAWRGLTATVFAGAGDARAHRMAVAAGARIGSVYPDISGEAVLALGSTFRRGVRARVPIVTDADHTGIGGARSGLMRVVDVTRGSELVALRDWDGALLDALAARGWRFVHAAPPSDDHAPPPRLDGLRVIHATSVHRPDDGRILHREVAALRAAGADATVLGFDPRPTRRQRPRAGGRLLAEAERRGADVLHIHDPELLPAAWRWRARTGRPVVYDAHEYLGQTTRTKPWIPAPLRRPTAAVAERVERTLAGRLDAVVTVTEDMALDFAEAGIDAVSVANFPPAGRFPEPGSPEPGLVVYVGALDPSRGRDLMMRAFPMVDAPGARLVLAGPGTPPADLPPRVEHLGRLPYEAVPALLDRASIVWMPLRRTPNNDRGRLTKVIEAMAAGRPLVASDLVRTAAIVRQAGCGLVVPADDPAAHAAALTELLRDPERARALGRAGRAAFLGGMSFDAEARKLVDLYARLAGRGG